MLKGLTLISKSNLSCFSSSPHAPLQVASQVKRTKEYRHEAISFVYSFAIFNFYKLNLLCVDLFFSDSNQPRRKMLQSQLSGSLKL